MLQGSAAKILTGKSLVSYFVIFGLPTFPWLAACSKSNQNLTKYDYRPNTDKY